VDDTAQVVLVCTATFNQFAGGTFNVSCVPQIAGGNPGQIHSFAGDLAGVLGKLSGLLSQLQQQITQLMKVWTSTQSAPDAMKTFTKAFTTFQHMIDAIDKFIKALHAAADMVDKAMNGADAVVKKVDPAIGSKLATQQPAAVAAAKLQAVTMDSVVKSFLQGQKGALTGTAGTISSGTSNPLGTILQAIGSAINGTSATSTAAQPAVSAPAVSVPPISVPPVSVPPVSVPPVSLPTAPVASTPITTAVPGALQNYPYGYPTDTSAGSGFVPVDPGAATTPVHHVEVDFGANGDLLAVKSDIDATVDVQLRNADGTQVERMVHVSSNGTTTTV
jgi:uncharacterized protein YukE